MFFILSSPVSHFFSIRGSVSPHLLSKIAFLFWACFGAAEIPACLANKTCFHIGQAQGYAYLQKQTTSRKMKWPWKGRQFREKWGTLASFAKGRAGGDSDAEDGCPAIQVTVCDYSPGSFLLPWGKIRLLYMPRLFCKAPNPHREIPSLTRVQLLTCCALSPALNTTLIFSLGSCSWFSQGSHKSNFRACSNFWSWGDENSTSAHSKRISWPQVMSLIALTSVLSYMITWNWKTYSNTSPVVLLQCVGPGTVTLWMYSLVPGLNLCQTWSGEVEMSFCKGGGGMKLLSTKQKCCGKVLP